MTLTMYRQLTRPRYNNATGVGGDASTDATKIDPNKYVAMPIDRKLEIILIVLLIIVASLQIFKFIKP